MQALLYGGFFYSLIINNFDTNSILMATITITSASTHASVTLDNRNTFAQSGQFTPYTPDRTGTTVYLYDQRKIFGSERITLEIGVDTINVDGTTVFADAGALMDALAPIFFLSSGGGFPNSSLALPSKWKVATQTTAILGAFDYSEWQGIVHVWLKDTSDGQILNIVNGTNIYGISISSGVVTFSADGNSDTVDISAYLSDDYRGFTLSFTNEFVAVVPDDIQGTLLDGDYSSVNFTATGISIRQLMNSASTDMMVSMVLFASSTIGDPEDGSEYYDSNGKPLYAADFSNFGDAIFAWDANNPDNTLSQLADLSGNNSFATIPPAGQRQFTFITMEV